MSAPRLRRLAADYEAVRAEFSGHPHVHVEPLGVHLPPEAYRVTYRVRGLRLNGRQPQPVDEHQVEIRLPLRYPRDKPLCVALTPLFHPNVKDAYCIQDYWAAGQTLVDTIAKIADMIQYRVYNPASPLDALAARWASENSALFPLGNVSLGTAEVQITLGVRPGAAAVMATMPDVIAEAGLADLLAEQQGEPASGRQELLVSLRRGDG
jgi:ubiquitin-protein ligase